jgi:hypothetical protein
MERNRSTSPSSGDPLTCRQKSFRDPTTSIARNYQQIGDPSLQILTEEELLHHKRNWNWRGVSFGLKRLT